MRNIQVDPGFVLGFGGTNARTAVSSDGDIEKFKSTATPDKPTGFFAWTARQILDAAHDGSNWVVAGFPGLVSPDGKIIGPMENVQGLEKKQYDFMAELIAADSAMGELEIPIIPVNDGELAAHAAADTIGKYQYGKTASLIVGTGVGAGIVNLDPSYGNVCRADRTNPVEIGHVILGNEPWETHENWVSGTAIEHEFGIKPEDLPADHHVWNRVGTRVGQMASLLGLMNGANLVVPCGGVGAGGSNYYKASLDYTIKAINQRGNAAQRALLPEIVPVPQADAQTFELRGGESVMRDFLAPRIG